MARNPAQVNPLLHSVICLTGAAGVVRLGELNTSLFTSTMDYLFDQESVTNKDVENFAMALGFDAMDAGIFYQTYYELESEIVEDSEG